MRFRLIALLLALSLGASAQYSNWGTGAMQRQVSGADTTYRWVGTAVGSYNYGKSLSWYRNNFSPILTYGNGLALTGTTLKADTTILRTVLNSYNKSQIDSLIKKGNEIATIGDSMTARGEYQEELGELLNGEWTISNFGINGDRTEGVIKRLPIVIGGSPDYAIALVGVNDLSSLTSGQIQTNLQTIYTTLHNAGIKVVALTILPYGNYSQWTSGTQIKLEAVNTWIKTTAINVDHVIDAYTIMGDPLDTKDLNPIYDSGDGLHPNDAGYSLVGSSIFSAVTFVKNSLSPQVRVFTDVNLDQDVSSFANVVHNSIETSSIKVVNNRLASTPAPVMTQAYRGSLDAPAEGEQIFNSTTHLPNWYDGTGWVAPITSITPSLPLTGGTLTGGLAGTTVAMTGSIKSGTNYEIDATAGTNNGLFFKRSASNRWYIFYNSVAESGSNVGSNFGISAYADNGAFLNQPISITRATGHVQMITQALGTSLSLGLQTLRPTVDTQKGWVYRPFSVTQSANAYEVQDLSANVLMSISPVGNVTAPVVNVSGLTASRVVVTDGSKNLSSSSVTPTELGLLSGKTSIGTVTTFGKTDGYAIASSVANATTTPNLTIAVDSATLSLKYIRRNEISSNTGLTQSNMVAKVSDVKAYADTKLALAGGNLTGTVTSNSDIRVNNASLVLNRSVDGNTGVVKFNTSSATDWTLGTPANIADKTMGLYNTSLGAYAWVADYTNNKVTFVTSPSVPTQSPLDLSDNAASTAYVDNAIAAAAPSYPNGSWTPTSSTVTLTVNYTYYQTVGKMTTAFFDITFPVSASPNQVIIQGLPGAPYNFYPVTFGVNDSGLTLYGATVTSGSSIELHDSSNNIITYTQMSGKHISGSVTYRIP